MTQQMTKWTRKQAGVIYRAHKAGELAVSAETISRMYDLVNDGSGIDFNGELNREIQAFKTIVDHIFEGELDKAQAMVDRIEGNETNAIVTDDDELEDADTYTTSTGITYVYWEQGDGFGFYEKGDAASEDDVDFIDDERELFEHFEKMNAWRAA